MFQKLYCTQFDVETLAPSVVIRILKHSVCAEAYVVIHTVKYAADVELNSKIVYILRSSIVVQHADYGMMQFFVEGSLQ